MNKSSVLLIAGGAVVAGVAVYGVYKYLQSKDDVTVECQKAAPVAATPKTEVADSSAAASAFEETQAETVSSIKDRHVAAAQQMEATLSEMTADCAEFDEKITQVNDDLDELLK